MARLQEARKDDVIFELRGVANEIERILIGRESPCKTGSVARTGPRVLGGEGGAHSEIARTDL